MQKKIGNNRNKIIQAGGVSKLLAWAQSQNVEVQRDALGAIRNLTLTSMLSAGRSTLSSPY